LGAHFLWVARAFFINRVVKRTTGLMCDIHYLIAQRKPDFAGIDRVWFSAL
jgi:hypothetical protein